MNTRQNTNYLFQLCEIYACYILIRDVYIIEITSLITKTFEILVNDAISKKHKDYNVSKSHNKSKK